MNGVRARKVSRCCCCSLRPKPRTLARFDDLTTILHRVRVCVCVCCVIAVEGARPHTSNDGSAYADYSPDEAAFYMQKTKQWVSETKRGCEAASRQQERNEL
jgi:hypothetical protein